MGGQDTTRPPGGILDRVFHLEASGTTVRTELLAGLTTFMTMAYIIFVNPSIISTTGMPVEAAMYATAISAAFATLVMGFVANYPIALAPGMGLNAYFTYTVVMGMGVPWQTALGAVLISGMLFIVLTLTKVREAIIDAVPPALKGAISAGIGLFIAFIGLKNGGVIVDNPATLVSLAGLHEPQPVLTLLGIVVTAVLLARNVKGAILLGIVVTAFIGIPMGVTVAPEGVFQVPSLARWTPVLGKLDVAGAFRLGFLDIIFAFVFVDMFDTVGTLIGVAKQGGFLDQDGKLPRASRALLADSLGTVGGAFFGTPTVTSYIESTTGVAEGGRTGLTAVTVAVLFLLSLFVTPLVAAIGQVPAITAPALVIVGTLMVRAITDIDWGDTTEAVPAFVAIIAMPLTYSIATGIALAFIAFPVIKLLSGRGKEAHWMMYVLALLFVLRFVYLSGG